MLKTDGHGTIRKVKGGAVGVIALSGLMLSMNAVSADTQVVSTNNRSTFNVSSSNDNVQKEIPKNTDKEVYRKVENANLKPSDALPVRQSSVTTLNFSFTTFATVALRA